MYRKQSNDTDSEGQEDWEKREPATKNKETEAFEQQNEQVSVYLEEEAAVERTVWRKETISLVPSIA